MPEAFRSKVPVEVFQSSAGEFEDDAGKSVKYSNVVVRVGNAVMKMKTDTDLSEHQGQEIDVWVEWRVGGKLAPSPVIVEVA